MFYIFDRLIISLVGFLYPAYASYKAIKGNDLAVLERWLMFWSVMGVVGAVEGAAEWAVSWLPFYYEVKALFILWLTLPQTEGSTYLYNTYLEPLFIKHEREIDETLTKLRARAWELAGDWLRKLWATARGTVLGAQAAEAQAAQPPPPQQPPPTPSRPAALFSGFNSLVATYGPAALAAGAQLLKPPPTISATGHVARSASPLGSSTATLRVTADERSRRRAALEVELARLAEEEGGPGTAGPSSGQSSRTGSRSGFEEIDGGEAESAPETDEGIRRRSSGWFGWGAGGGSQPTTPAAK